MLVWAWVLAKHGSCDLSQRARNEFNRVMRVLYRYPLPSRNCCGSEGVHALADFCWNRLALSDLLL